MERTEQLTETVRPATASDAVSEAVGQAAFLQALSEQLYLDALRYDGNISGGAL